MEQDPRVISARSSVKLSQETTGPLLVDLIAEHFSSCHVCTPSERPVSMGQESGLCDDYWRMVEAWARNEGHLNNVVAQDEYGNQAPRTLP